MSCGRKGARLLSPEAEEQAAGSLRPERPAARVASLTHFVLCAVMKAANSLGVSHCATIPKELKRSTVADRLKSAANAALSLSTIGCGVPARAKSPAQLLAS